MLALKTQTDYRMEYLYALDTQGPRQCSNAWHTKEGKVCAISLLMELHGFKSGIEQGWEQRDLPGVLAKVGMSEDLLGRIITASDHEDATFHEIGTNLAVLWGLKYEFGKEELASP